MQPWDQGVKTRLVNLRWNAILPRGSVVAYLSNGNANLFEGGRVMFLHTRGKLEASLAHIDAGVLKTRNAMHDNPRSMRGKG